MIGAESGRTWVLRLVIKTELLDGTFDGHNRSGITCIGLR